MVSSSGRCQRGAIPEDSTRKNNGACPLTQTSIETALLTVSRLAASRGGLYDRVPAIRVVADVRESPELFKRRGRPALRREHRVVRNSHFLVHTLLLGEGQQKGTIVHDSQPARRRFRLSRARERILVAKCWIERVKSGHHKMLENQTDYFGHFPAERQNCRGMALFEVNGPLVPQSCSPTRRGQRGVLCIRITLPP